MRFAFIVHPITMSDIAKKYPLIGMLPDGMTKSILRRMSPKVASQITGIKGKGGEETSGIFVGAPLTSTMFLEEPLDRVYDTLHECVRIAEEEGCEIIGLGAYTSVVGDAGMTVAERANIAVTTGNSYTVATAIQGLEQACDLVGMDKAESTLGVVGATGSIGLTCAQALAPHFGRTLVVGRSLERSSEAAAKVQGSEPAGMDRLVECDAVVTVTSADTAVIEPSHLKSGAVVCDVARPRDVSVKVVQERSDVLVIEGGVVRIPGTPEFGLDFGFPRGTAYACMAETMMLAMEGRRENFTLGRDVSVEQVRETRAMADRLGLELEGFRAFERAVDPVDIERVRRARMGEAVTAA